MVQTKSSRGQCYIYFTGVALVLSVSGNDRIDLRDYSYRLHMVFETIPLLLFSKGISCCEMPHFWKSVMMKQPCNPANYSCIHFKSAILFGVEVTCHS